MTSRYAICVRTARRSDRMGQRVIQGSERAGWSPETAQVAGWNHAGWRRGDGLPRCRRGTEFDRCRHGVVSTGGLAQLAGLARMIRRAVLGMPILAAIMHGHANHVAGGHLLHRTHRGATARGNPCRRRERHGQRQQYSQQQPEHFHAHQFRRSIPYWKRLFTLNDPGQPAAHHGEPTKAGPPRLAGSRPPACACLSCLACR